MAALRQRLFRYRVALLALFASALIHAGLFIGLPGQLTRADDRAAAIYSAVLEEGGMSLEGAGDTPAPAPKAARRAATKPRPKPSIAPPPKPDEIVAETPAAAAEPMPTEPAVPVQSAEPDVKPEVVALAAPPPLAQAEPEPFPAHALPGRIKITYALTSSFAEGRAVYEWERNGDDYVISGEAHAEGFFTLFLEGRVLQESRGKVTSEGLRPDRFTESRPKTSPEGLEFDWKGRKVVFERNGEKNVAELKDNTVDWLSMIFQLAHRPPKGDAFDLSVFTQRRMYHFRMKVLGEEEIEIPMGKLRALHLRHEDEAKGETVDVWLGINQHYVPVKMRYPVARNRIMVEQTATRISVREP